MSDEPRQRYDEDESPGWIERVADVAAAFGMNRVRVRWKLQRWHTERRRAKNRRAQAIVHLEYEHKVCPKCTAVNARDEQVCTRCGTKLSARPLELAGRLGLRGPVIGSMSTVIALMITVAYARTVVAAGKAVWEIPVRVLWQHGGNLPKDVPDFEAWRYATSVFLHGGLMHILFNLLSLSVVGPSVEEEYGRWPTMFLFMATGVIASIATRMTGLDGVGIGASGAIMGLIGAVAGAGQRAGNTRGRLRRNAMLKGAAYVFLFGFAVGADNRAHLAGFVAGGVLGFAITPRMMTKRVPRIVGGVLGAIAFVAMLGTVALIMVPPTPIASAALESAARDDFDPYAEIRRVAEACANGDGEACQALDQIEASVCNEDRAACDELHAILPAKR